MIKIINLSPIECVKGCKNLIINYSFSRINFGNILIASTSKGICFISFIEEKFKAIELLKKNFPNAYITHQIDEIQENVICYFNNNYEFIKPINLNVKGTPFQLKVWDTLLKIPFGQLTNYEIIANEIGQPKASRAVGTAIGKNPVALLIPCHRVIQKSGNLGGYMWGTKLKLAIINWESNKLK